MIDWLHLQHQPSSLLLVGHKRAPIEWNHRSPGELGVRKIGHFGFFRDQFSGSLWAETTDWIKRQADRVSRASAPAAMQSAAP